MKNTQYLSSSIEAARVAAAEDQMTPAPAPDYPFNLDPVDKQFKAYLPPPLFFSDVTSICSAKEWHLKYIRALFHLGGGDYTVRASPWATTDQIAQELKDLILPF